jgi:hypothetical protein
MNCDVFCRLQEIEAEFDKHVSIKDITQHMDVDPEARQYIYNYWKLKRKVTTSEQFCVLELKQKQPIFIKGFCNLI